MAPFILGRSAGRRPETTKGPQRPLSLSPGDLPGQFGLPQPPPQQALLAHPPLEPTNVDPLFHPNTDKSRTTSGRPQPGHDTSA
jgi:hypothetical protein